MARAVDVARYILEQREARGHMTTTYALQKLLYYCQSWMLVARDRPLFDDKIEAWQHGPVVTSVFPYCSRRHYIFPREIPDGHASALRIEERALVDRILSLHEDADDDGLGDRLESMSHAERPWADAVDREDKTISLESMLDYYSMLQANPSMSEASEVPLLADVSDRSFISQEDADWLDSFLSD